MHAARARASAVLFAEWRGGRGDLSLARRGRRSSGEPLASSSTTMDRPAVFSAVALLLLAAGADAFFDFFNSDSYGDEQEGEAPPPMEKEEERTVEKNLTIGLTKVPPTGSPSKVAEDREVFNVPDRDTAGNWSIMSDNSGVSAMHLVVMRHHKAIMFDTTTTGRSLMRLNQDNCRVDPRAKKKGGGAVVTDCWAHAVQFNFTCGATAIKPLKILTDTWCSSGGLDADGNLVQTGGYFEGEKAVRYLSPCDGCDWREHPRSFAEGRWYATQQVLPDGRFVVIGGRRSFSYEFVPKPGHTNAQAIPLPFLRETTDDVENNLYPFVHLLPDGSIFLFANDRSIIIDHRSELIIRELPKLPGGARNYPASGMSALLPLDLRNVKPHAETEPEIIICGGAPKDAFRRSENNTFRKALADCGRIKLASPDAQWELEEMLPPRVMGDMLILPTGDLLLINGAMRGSAGWGFGRRPVLNPVLYSPHAPPGKRFRNLTASTIPRMFHSTAAVLPDATVLVAGSNTNPAYNFSGVDFPTEVRVERFTPPYLSKGLSANRPEIDWKAVPGDGMRYGAKFTFRFRTPVAPVGEPDVKVTMYAPPFTTHGNAMNQRLLILAITAFVVDRQDRQRYEITVDAPHKPELAPPGYYLVYVVAKDVPSVGVWVKIQS